MALVENFMLLFLLFLSVLILSQKKIFLLTSLKFLLCEFTCNRLRTQRFTHSILNPDETAQVRTVPSIEFGNSFWFEQYYHKLPILIHAEEKKGHFKYSVCEPEFNLRFDSMDSWLKLHE